MKDIVDILSDSLAHATQTQMASVCGTCGQDTLPEPISALMLRGLGYWAVVVGFVAIVVVCYHLVLPSRLRNALWDKGTRWFLPVLFAVAWTMGFVVYCVGGYAQGFNMLSVVFMAIIHATEMFVGNSDISAVQDAQHLNGTYMVLFGLSHFLALTCSLLFIVRQIGFFFISRLKAWWVSVWGAAKDECYVFWGINDASLTLAEAIVDYCRRRAQDAHDGRHAPSYRLVFVRTHDDSDKENEGFNPQNLFDKIRTSKSTLQSLRRLNGVIVSSTKRLSMQTIRTREDVLGDVLGLYALRRIIGRKSRHTHIFIISEDGEANAKAAINMTCDATIKSADVEIYCHCRESATTQSLQYYEATHPDEHTAIHIVDTSYLSVSQLRMDATCHPVHHVKVNADATIDTPFSALIVGFGETGQEALRFLYEFGAFVGSDGRKSPFRCDVFDKNMDQRCGLFLAQVPYMQGSNEVTFHAHAIDSPGYWNAIAPQLIQHLNYIVICPGSDDLALEAASNLCSMAIRCRTEASPDQLAICIRSYDMQNVARLRDFCRDINDKYRRYGIHLYPFGILKELFTYEYIIQNELLRQAMAFNYSYSDSPEGVSQDVLWRRNLGYHDTDADYSIDEIEEIERKRRQNFSNALHGPTKLHILAQTGCGADIPDHIIENMARLEHERWMASMHINGWQRLRQPIVGQDGNRVTRQTVRKLHADLCPWEEIRSWDKDAQEETQGYDRKVLTTTLALAGQSPTNRRDV